jgi:hypothetical protein
MPKTCIFAARCPEPREAGGILRGVTAVVIVALCAVASPAHAVVFITDTTILAGDSTYDGQEIVVDGATLTIGGAHSFAALTVSVGGIVTHAAADPDFELTIAGDATIEAGGSIDVSGLTSS